MRPTQFISLLELSIPAHKPILVVSDPGVGKTQIIHQVTERLDADMILSHPVVSDATDAKGLPFPSPDGQTARWLPYGDLARAMNAQRLTVWFLDDLGQAAPSVQASFMQLILSRRINEHKLNDHIVFLAATNPRTAKSGVQGILEAVKSRFTSIVHLETDINDWSVWALTHAIVPEVLAFLRFRPDLLHAFNPTTDMTNSPCPRTWEAVSDLVKLQLPKELELETYGGAVGEAAAAEFVGFLRVWRTLPNLDGILIDPNKAAIPPRTEPATLYAVATGLAHKATTGNFKSIATYAQRMVKGGVGEFATLMVKDAFGRTPEIGNTAAFIELATGDFGKMLNN